MMKVLYQFLSTPWIFDIYSFTPKYAFAYEIRISEENIFHIFSKLLYTKMQAYFELLIPQLELII